VKLSLSRSLSSRSESELLGLHDVWVGGETPRKRAEVVRALRSQMQDPAAAAAVRSELDPAAERLLCVLLATSEDGLQLQQIREAVRNDGLQPGTVRAVLAQLLSLGLAMPVGGRNRTNVANDWVVPREIGVALRTASAAISDPAGMLTLRGNLDRRFRRQSDGGGDPADQARRMYRFLAGESAILRRIAALPDDLRDLLVAAVTHHGGLVPVAELGELGARPSSAARIRRVFEDSGLGTVEELDLERFGIRQRGQVLAIFNEVVLVWLRHSATSKPVHPAEHVSLGVDFVSNFSRFASFIGDQNVRFTVHGTIFKSTGKRIAESLIPNPGKEFHRREILDLLYRFALAYRMIDRTGERSFRQTDQGTEFLRLPLEEKQRLILDWLIEDRNLPGDLAHQLRLRRTTLRYLKRLEPNVWYDAMFLPFVARNHYLATLAAEAADGHDGGSFPVRSSADVRSLAWNLFTWIRKHLYLIGIVDVGYDDSGRSCAIRLTSMGAELLGMIPGRELEGSGHIVVNPDFEVVLFPEERSHALIYELDRFCQRELTDSLYHYRITPGSLHRALSEGEALDEILELLRRLSRTPLPQNVVYSLESWARSKGMVTFHEDGRLVCDTPEVLDKLQLHPELGRLGVHRVDRETLRLRAPVDQEDLLGWVRDFGVSLRIAS